MDADSARREPELRGRDRDRTPLYHQIYLILRAKIFDGEYPLGFYIPGERDLERMYGVSRITAVRALNELAAAGLVVRERGRGTRVQFVSGSDLTRGPAVDRPDGPATAGTTREVFDRLRRDGQANVTLLEFEYAIPVEAIRQALRLSARELVQFATRVWRFEGRPISYMETHVPGDLGARWSRQDMETTSIFDLLERHGIEVAVIREQITATLADALLAERLDTPLGSPLLKIRRLSLDREDRPLELFTGYFLPDRYQYEISFPVTARSGANAR